MLDGLFMLLTLSTVMAIASFLAGSLPLSFSLSQSRLRLISTIGMGVLVGTALIVIIPEGVETLYSASDPLKHTHERRHLSPQLHSIQERQLRESYQDDALQRPRWIQRREDEPEPDTTPFEALPGPVIPSDTTIESDHQDPPKTPTAEGEISILETDDHDHDHDTAQSHPSESHTRTPHAWIGLSLILGFILMYLLDTLPQLAPSSRTPPRQNIYSLSDLSTASSPTGNAPPPPRSFSTTLGLCIHAAADGIALGASSSSSTTKSLSFIIFLAIMVHKAPAAFGLTSVLLKQGLGKRAARAHLVFFSLAAPAGAVATWMVVRTLGGGAAEGAGEESMRWWTGVLLLFSGGTFLYVAMHTMQDEDHSNSMLDDTQGNGYIDGSHLRERSQSEDGRSLKLVLAAVGGMLLPLITQIGHAH